MTVFVSQLIEDDRGKYRCWGLEFLFIVNVTGRVRTTLCIPWFYKCLDINQPALYKENNFDVNCTYLSFLLFRECKGNNVTESRCFYLFMIAEGKEALESRPLYGGGKSSIPAGCSLLFTT
jgi:hypothetical protein